MAAVWKQIARLDEVVANADYPAFSIMVANTIATPVAVELATSNLIGRKATGNIVPLTGADVLTILGIGAGASGVVKIVADAAALAGLSATAVEGWFALQQDNDSLWLCTAPA